MPLSALWVSFLALAAAGAEGRYVQIADRLGIDFVHDHGGSGQRYMVETMGSGLGWIDYDGDGWSDLYLVQGQVTPGANRPQALRNRLYRNLAGRRFEDVTAAAGVGDPGYGQGVAVGDYDRDGDLDLYVVNFGANVLYRNDGKGHFTDVTVAAGVGDPRWGSSAAFGDLDGDGWPDLYVVNYVDFNYDHHLFCGNAARQIRTYCHPDVYDAVPDVLYHNNRDGSFSEATHAAGVDHAGGKGLGVVVSDLDGDGDLDLYVANDSTPNLLYRSDGHGRFEEIGAVSGTAYNGDGKAQAGMGVDSGDGDGDGRFDLVVTNLDFEGLAFYHNLGDGFFDEVTRSIGLLTPSLNTVGFGVSFLDFDNDGDLDLIVGNGHIIDNVALIRPSQTHAQLPQLYRNLGGGRFEPVGEAEGGAVLGRALVVRGLATCDFDNDGDIDVALATNNGPVQLWENSGSKGHALAIKVIGRNGEAAPVGTRVVAKVGGVELVRELHGGGSYQSAPDQRIHVGLGEAEEARLKVIWLGGKEEELGVVKGDQLLVVREGAGIVRSTRFGGAHR
jgi:hypothetical protein